MLSTCLFPIRGQGGGQGGHLGFLIGQKITNFVEVVEILPPVKLSCIPLSALKKKVENISANQRLGWPSWNFNRPRNTKFIEDVKILLPVQFC